MNFNTKYTCKVRSKYLCICFTDFKIVAVKCVVDGGVATMEMWGKSIPLTFTFFGETGLGNEIIRRKLKEENKLLKISNNKWKRIGILRKPNGAKRIQK